MSEEHDPLDPEALNATRRVQQVSEKAKDQTDAEDIRWQMSSPRGRRIVMGLLEEAGVFRITFNTNSMQMAFNEGCRNQGLKLINRIHAHCPDKYLVMINEAKK